MLDQNLNLAPIFVSWVWDGALREECECVIVGFQPISYLNASLSSLLQTCSSRVQSPPHPVGSLSSSTGRQVGRDSDERARQTSFEEQESQ